MYVYDAHGVMEQVCYMDSLLGHPFMLSIALHFEAKVFWMQDLDLNIADHGV